jgi:hypothetical protein
MLLSRRGRPAGRGVGRSESDRKGGRSRGGGATTRAQLRMEASLQAESSMLNPQPTIASTPLNSQSADSGHQLHQVNRNDRQVSPNQPTESKHDEATTTTATTTITNTPVTTGGVSNSDRAIDNAALLAELEQWKQRSLIMDNQVKELQRQLSIQQQQEIEELQRQQEDEEAGGEEEDEERKLSYNNIRVHADHVEAINATGRGATSSTHTHESPNAKRNLQSAVQSPTTTQTTQEMEEEVKKGKGRERKQARDDDYDSEDEK